MFHCHYTNLTMATEQEMDCTMKFEQLTQALNKIQAIPDEFIVKVKHAN